MNTEQFVRIFMRNIGLNRITKNFCTRARECDLGLSSIQTRGFSAHQFFSLILFFFMIWWIGVRRCVDIDVEYSVLYGIKNWGIWMDGWKREVLWQHASYSIRVKVCASVLCTEFSLLHQAFFLLTTIQWMTLCFSKFSLWWNSSLITMANVKIDSNGRHVIHLLFMRKHLIFFKLHFPSGFKVSIRFLFGDIFIVSGRWN